MRIIIPNNKRLSLYKYTPSRSYIWWDASDANVITEQTGVSQISDKGSLGIDIVQSTASTQPTFNSIQQNGLSTISFNKANSQYLAVDISENIINNSVISIAFKPTGIDNAYASCMSYNGDGDDFQIDSNSTSDWIGHLRPTGYGSAVFDSSPSINTPQVLTLENNVNEGFLKGYKNGVLKFTINSFTGWDVTDINLRLSANRANSVYMSMDFYEFVVAPIKDKEQLNNYLMNKWNIN